MEKYTIEVYGCDDCSLIEMELTESEVAVINRVAKEITKASKYQCQPTMEINETNTK